MSRDYDNGFLVSLNIWITQTKSYYYSFRSPSCFNLFHKCFDFYEGNDLNIKSKMLLLCCMNIALIKNIDNDNVFMNNFVNNLKQILGSLRSYGFFQKKVKKTKNQTRYMRKKDFIQNTKFSRKKK
ncbi:MAG: hypothetical protein EOP33_06440 [Rickettsiaceae bacterium]|nr:MAG: hypothetical protein EOP33_06440 [Rickettsiaceae bacterium]